MWGLVSAALVAILVVLSSGYSAREVERETRALERAAGYASSLVEVEIARLEENARAVAGHRGFAVRTGLYLEGDESIGPFLQERVESEVRARGYVCVQLLDPQGEPLFLSVGEDQCPGIDVELATAAVERREVLKSDMGLVDGAPPLLRWAVPLVPREGAAPVAVVLLNSNVSPVIDGALALPGPGASFDAVIAGGEDASQAPEGRITGTAPIDGTPWSVVASIERDEVLRQASTFSVIGSLTIIAASIALALGLVLLRRTAAQRDREYHANTVLAERIKAEERFVASMSHELRTPLNSIIGFARVLESGTAGPVNDEQRKQLLLVASAGKRLLALVNDILDLSKARAGMTLPKPTDFTAAGSINHVAEVTCPLSQEKGLKCSLSLPAEEIVLHSDRELLERILLNLTGNAIKFTPPGGSVHLEVREAARGRMVEFAITDTGYGIEADEMGRIMDEFFQGTSVPQHERATGTGLGLPISQRLARLLGGTIRFSSELGKGSTFVLQVPRRIPVWPYVDEMDL